MLVSLRNCGTRVVQDRAGARVLLWLVVLGVVLYLDARGHDLSTAVGMLSAVALLSAQLARQFQRRDTSSPPVE
ncbi:hypothetical protein GCM10022247_35390 [Allokutzneria multivorans]|uniref:Uncharacterized protein n=1 Tax=Allokutzneria multivorans TaxID=1142134 RepID=A0ABP7SD07_9PSEU